MSRKRSASSAAVTSISASEFKATCLELMEQVARSGRDVVVTKHGRPVVRVTAASAVAESPWGFLRSTIVRHGDIVSPDHDAWAASATDPLASRGRR